MSTNLAPPLTLLLLRIFDKKQVFFCLFLVDLGGCIQPCKKPNFLGQEVDPLCADKIWCFFTLPLKQLACNSLKANVVLQSLDCSLQSSKEHSENCSPQSFLKSLTHFKRAIFDHPWLQDQKQTLNLVPRLLWPKFAAFFNDHFKVSFLNFEPN